MSSFIGIVLSAGQLLISIVLFAGQSYFLNQYTKESQWDVPTEPAKPDASKGGPDKVQCSHLLVKHAGSRRPSSWKEENITRNKEEAVKMVEGSVFDTLTCNPRLGLRLIALLWWQKKV